MGVKQGLNETVAGEGLLVGVGGLQTLVAVRHLTGDASLYSIQRRVLLAELTLDPDAGRCHGFAVGSRALTPSFAGRIRSTKGDLLVTVDDVL